jgi:hypothetical protein
LDRLTYHQFCALAFIADPDRQGEREMMGATVGEAGVVTTPILIAELNELATLGLVGYTQEDGSVVNPMGTWNSTPVSANTMPITAPTELGRSLIGMAELNTVPVDDVAAIGDALSGNSS